MTAEPSLARTLTGTMTELLLPEMHTPLERGVDLATVAALRPRETETARARIMVMEEEPDTETLTSTLLRITILFFNLLLYLSSRCPLWPRGRPAFNNDWNIWNIK